MTAGLIFAFMVGAVSTVNPCGFALLPAYFARRLAVDTVAAPDRAAAVAVALAAGFAATLGFTIVFGAVGMAILLGAVWLNLYLSWAGLAIGVALVAIGLVVLFGGHVGLRLAHLAPRTDRAGLRGDFYFGLGFGTASLTCTLPIFLSVVGVALTGSLLASLLNIVAFAFGMGTILAAIAVAAALSHDGLAGKFKRFLPFAHRFGGAVLLLVGLYVVAYWASVLFIEGIPGPNSLVAIGERLSGSLRNWLAVKAGAPVILGLLTIFVAVLGWHLWQGAQANRRGHTTER